MVNRAALRRGHSLVELIVALVLLGLGFGAVASAALLGARWTAQGVARQEAVVLAGAALDSLVAFPPPSVPATGQLRQGRTVVLWTAEAEAPDQVVVRVVVTWPGATSPVRLVGWHVPAPPLLEARP